ncbi:hypothetical protein RYZ27_13180 [Hyphomonas sp. FCG-A18]|uniref:hypothetical protein n=1 Tax=Hyphomonas sp. FCG-A18 TaxID=3080019 RepID=UPI002B28DFE9|nr:hypothetical protein RYZ27_13180 [Hyphomonas sp. FCG-A18]
MNIWIISAAGFSAFTTLVHFFAGGATVARPLLDAKDIDKVAKLVNYFCWHIATLVLAGTALGYAYVAMAPEQTVLLLALSGFSGACCLLNLGIILRYGMSLMAMPQWLLLGGMSALGFAGHATL